MRNQKHQSRHGSHGQERFQQSGGGRDYRGPASQSSGGNFGGGNYEDRMDAEFDPRGDRGEDSSRYQYGGYADRDWGGQGGRGRDYNNQYGNSQGYGEGRGGQESFRGGPRSGTGGGDWPSQGSGSNWQERPRYSSGGYGNQQAGPGQYDFDQGAQNAGAGYGGTQREVQYGPAGRDWRQSGSTNWPSRGDQFGQTRSFGQGSGGGANYGSGEFGQGYGGQSGSASNRSGGSESAGYASAQRSGPIRRGPKGWQRSDERLKEDISERLYDTQHIDSSEVTVDVTEGKVTLEGTVSDRYMKHAIEDLVDQCPGVKDIENRIRVARDSQQSSMQGNGQKTSNHESSSASSGTSQSTGVSSGHRSRKE